MYFVCKYGFRSAVLYYVRDNSPWWANVHCKSNLTINTLSYSYSYNNHQYEPPNWVVVWLPDLPSIKAGPQGFSTHKHALLDDEGKLTRNRGLGLLY